MPSQEELIKLIEEGKTRKALEKLLAERRYFSEDIVDELAHLSNRFERNEKANRTKTIPRNEYLIEDNQINQVLIELITKKVASSSIKPPGFETSRVKKISILLFPLFIALLPFYFQSNRVKIVHFSPKIEGNTVLFRFRQLNADFNRDPFHFNFQLNDTLNFMIEQPGVRNFRPKYLVHPSRSEYKFTTLDPENEMKKIASRIFRLKDVATFQWEIRVKAIGQTNAFIGEKDFAISFCPVSNEAPGTDCSELITLSDYFLFYPWPRTIMILAGWFMGYAVFHLVTRKLQLK